MTAYLGLFEMDAEQADDLDAVTTAIAALRASDPDVSDRELAAVALAAMSAQQRTAGEVQSWVAVRNGLGNEEYRQIAVSLAGPRLQRIILDEVIKSITEYRRQSEAEMKSLGKRDTVALICASERVSALRHVEVMLRSAHI